MRVSTSRKVTGSKTAGFLCLPLQAEAGQTANRATDIAAVVLSCPTASDDLRATLISEITRRADPLPVLSAPAPQKNALHVTLDVTRQTDDILEGRLIWWCADRARRTGPLVEVSFTDTPLNAQALHGFARGLMQVSDLPL